MMHEADPEYPNSFVKHLKKDDLINTHFNSSFCPENLPLHLILCLESTWSWLYGIFDKIKLKTMDTHYES